LGFINPTLYTIGQSSSYNSDFHDITSGNNDTNGQSKFYNAVIGYDLTTGWGSMNGQPLMAALAGSSGFSVSTSTLSPETVSPGQSATSSIDVTAVGGFNNSVSFTCSVSPSPQLAPQCSLTPSSVTPGTPATLTVTTTAPTMALSTPLGRSCVFYAFSLPLFGVSLIRIKFGSARARNRKLPVLLFAALLITGLVLQAACGGGSSGGSHGSIGTPAGNYTVTVTGTSGSLHHTASVSLMVQ
jgi:hypothetical protein